MALSKINTNSIADDAITGAKISGFSNITGGVVQEYELSGTNYRSHSFLNAGPHRFSTSTSLTVDFLIVGGGGGSAPSEGNNGSTGGASFSADSNDRRNLICATTATSNLELIEFRNPNGTVGDIKSNGSATSYNTSSDGRLKEVTGVARGLDVINKLNPVAFNWKVDNKASEGLIAQEVKDLVPDAVSQNTKTEYYQMDYSKLVVHLIAGMKEQQEQIDALQSEIKILKGE